MQIGPISVGTGEPLVLVSGLNVLEDVESAVDIARRIQDAAGRHGFPLVFKASFDKANRSSHDSYRGPGLEDGLRMLARVKAETGLPITTDVHEPWQAQPVAEVADCLQVPAFLSRQTDLIAACAATGRPLNFKKAQFMAPHDAGLAVAKAEKFGATGVMLTERGTSFGYNNQIVDFRGFGVMRQVAPVCFDATHSAQRPVAQGKSSGGDRDCVAPLARAAVAYGIDALFIEVHHDPSRARCDGAVQLPVDDLDGVLAEVKAIDAAVERRSS